MYCKKCGRKLRSEARFCDHCGQSTKTASRTTQKSGTPSKSRAEYEKNKKKRELERQRVQKKRKTALFLILFAIAMATVLGFASYNMTKKELDKNKQPLEETILPETTDKPHNADIFEDVQEEVSEEDTNSKETPAPTQSSKPEKEEIDYKDIADLCNIYRDDKMDNIRCPYPESFEQGSKSNKNTVISLVDPLNDGAMMISAQTVSSGQSASSLMKDYAEGVGGTIKSSRAGDGWYELSFERNNKLNHRKALVVDGLCVYYDFSYDSDSVEKDSYEEYIEYIDYYLDKELASATKKNSDKE